MWQWVARGNIQTEQHLAFRLVLLHLENATGMYLPIDLAAHDPSLVQVLAGPARCSKR